MEYVFKKTKVCEDSILMYSEFLSKIFTSTNKFTFEYLHWQYKQNPQGMVVGYDAFYNDMLVGHYVTIPVLYMLHGKKTKALLSLNTATHPKHQGKGLFTKLATKTYEEGLKQNFSFVIGVSNQNSTYGFVKKLGFTLISPLDVKTGIGNISYSKKEYKLKPLWDDSTLDWRLNNPSENYFKNKSHLVSKVSKLGIYSLLYLFKNGPNLNQKIKTCSTPFKLWVGVGDIKVKGVFINLPKILKPSPLNLIFKDLSGDTQIPVKEDVLFELIDFDAY